MTPNVTDGPAPAAPVSPTGRIPQWFAVAALVAFALVLTRGRTAHVDIHTADEVSFLLGGRGLLTGTQWPGVAQCPLYSVLSALLEPFATGPVVPADLLYDLGIVGGPLLLVWAFAPLLPLGIRVLLGALWLTTPVVLQASTMGRTAPPEAYVYDVLGCFLAVGLAARGRWLAALVTSQLLTTVRPDALLFPFATAVALTVLGRRTTPWRVRMAWLAAGLLTLPMMALPSLQGRAWLAFRQHYGPYAAARQLAERLGVAPGQPVDNATALRAVEVMSAAFQAPDAIVAEHFPGATSLASAAWTDPRRFATFVAHNGAALPAALCSMLTPEVMPENLRSWFWVGLVVAAAAGWCRRRETGSSNRPLPPLVAAMSIGSLSQALPALWVGARPELIAPAFLLVPILLGRGLARLPWPRRACSAALAGAVLLVVAVAAGSPFQHEAAPPAVRLGVALLRTRPPAAGSVVLCAFPACREAYAATSGIRFVEPIDLGDVAGPEPLLADPRIDHILHDPELEREVPGLSAALEGHRDRDWMAVDHHGPVVLWQRQR